MKIRCYGTHIVFPLLLLLATSFGQAFQEKRIIELTPNDKTQLERQRNIVSGLIRDNFGYIKLEGYTSDLYYVQKIIDKQLIAKNSTYDLQALGVVFGDVMVKNLNLSWVVVEDRYGRSRALRFEDSDDLFFPVTMISRRAKSGMPVSIRALYKKVEDTVKQLTYKRSRYKPVPKPKF